MPMTALSLYPTLRVLMKAETSPASVICMVRVSLYGVSPLNYFLAVQRLSVILPFAVVVAAVVGMVVVKEVSRIESHR